MVAGNQYYSALFIMDVELYYCNTYLTVGCCLLTRPKAKSRDVFQWVTC
jgi:hypothetical protein